MLLEEQRIVLQEGICSTSGMGTEEVEIEGMLTGRLCPMMKASIFSYFTWQWMQSFITVGNKKPLEAEDLYDLVPDGKSLHCERRWLKAMEDERTKKNKAPGEPIWVWKLLYKSMGRKFMLGSVYKPIWLVIVVLQVYILRELVQIAQSTECLQWWWATMLVLEMLVTSVAQSICHHMCFTLGHRIGVKARATVAMAVFNKLQQMRLASLVNTNTGIMLNLVTNDTQKILDAAMFFHFEHECLVHQRADLFTNASGDGVMCSTHIGGHTLQIWASNCIWVHY